MGLHDYSPFITSGGTLTPPSATEPTITIVNDIELFYPFVSPTTTITLKRPGLGNLNAEHYRRVLNRSRSLDLKLNSPQGWPKYTFLRYNFTNLSITMRDSLLLFMSDTLGKEIGLRDFESRTWRGLIVNPDAQMFQVNRCHYAITLDFEVQLET